MTENAAYTGPTIEMRADGFHVVIAGERTVMPLDGFGDRLKMFNLMMALAQDMAKSDYPPENKAHVFELVADIFGAECPPFAMKYYQLAYQHLPSSALQGKLYKLAKKMRDEERASAPPAKVGKSDSSRSASRSSKAKRVSSHRA